MKYQTSGFWRGLVLTAGIISCQATLPIPAIANSAAYIGFHFHSGDVLPSRWPWRLHALSAAGTKLPCVDRTATSGESIRAMRVSRLCGGG
jgi:hypothetical protein